MPLPGRCSAAVCVTFTHQASLVWVLKEDAKPTGAGHGSGLELDGTIGTSAQLSHHSHTPRTGFMRPSCPGLSTETQPYSIRVLFFSAACMHSFLFAGQDWQGWVLPGGWGEGPGGDGAVLNPGAVAAGAELSGEHCSSVPHGSSQWWGAGVCPGPSLVHDTRWESGMGCGSKSWIIQRKKSPWAVPQFPHLQRKRSALKTLRKAC